jgi:hypothetical protein
MTKLYIADADDHSRTPGSVRGRAVRSFIESNYGLEYISLSVDKLSPVERLESSAPKKFWPLSSLKPAGINRSFRCVDSSIFRKSFFRNLWRIIRTSSRDNKIEIIYCSYKPASAIWLGLVAKLLNRLPLVIEYRDLMSAFGDRDVSTLQRRLLNTLDQKIEALLLKFIDSVVVVNDTQSREFYAAFGRESTVVMNGIDGQINWHKYGNLHSNASHDLKIGYAGQLSKRRQLSCLSVVDGKYTLELMSKEQPYDYGLQPSVACNEYGFLEKNEMNEVLDSCDCFLLIEGVTDSSKGNLPSKVFEYMRFCKPVLFSGNEQSDVALILKKVGLLIMLPNDGARIDLHNELKKVMRSFDPSHLLEYAREQQLNKLRRILDKYII